MLADLALLFIPFCSTSGGVIAAILFGPGNYYRGLVPSVVGDLRFSVNYPAFDTRPPDDRAPENCPLVPSQALSDSFSRTTR